jgi:homoserine dehydrogenase
MNTIRLGLLGCGNVGSALVRQIEAQRSDIAARTGIALEVGGIAVRNLALERDVPVAHEVFTHDADELVLRPDIDVVVEMIGGIEPARRLILAALQAGKPVITANKELLANVGAELFAAADAAGVDLLFEASVAGGIPLMRPLRESLVGEPIRRVIGIVNGTTNYILSKMTKENASFAEALAEAQSLGFAERDPTADVEGFDAAAKASIIASIAFGALVVAGDVYREGIASLQQADIASATNLGYAIKLLAIAEEHDGSLAVRVHPTLVPLSHPLASVHDSFNAVFIEGDRVGSLMFYGRGAGGDPTASAVLGDVIDAASNRVANGRASSVGTLHRRKVRPIDDVESQFLVRLTSMDEPGVLATIAAIFAEHRVSIRSMQQHGTDGAIAELVFITHAARESDFRATIHDLRLLPSVQGIGSVIRVLDGDQ